jgi:hypothetical protein
MWRLLLIVAAVPVSGTSNGSSSFTRLQNSPELKTIAAISRTILVGDAFLAGCTMVMYSISRLIACSVLMSKR